MSAGTCSQALAQEGAGDRVAVLAVDDSLCFMRISFVRILLTKRVRAGLWCQNTKDRPVRCRYSEGLSSIHLAEISSVSTVFVLVLRLLGLYSTKRIVTVISKVGVILRKSKGTLSELRSFFKFSVAARSQMRIFP